MNKILSIPTGRFSRLLSSLARVLPAAFALVVLAVPPGAVAQTPTFATLKQTSANLPFGFVQGAAVADFNGDGKLDTILTDSSGTLRVMLGNGDGTFAEHNLGFSMMGGTYSNVVGLPANVASYLPVPIDGFGLVQVADVNGDGKPDLVCVTGAHINFAPYWFVSVLINNGPDATGVPQFTATQYFAIGNRSLTIGDLNGDGKPDFIVGDAYGNFQTFLNDGLGNFVAQPTLFNVVPQTGGPSTGPGVIVDVNGDGKADFIESSGQAGATNIFLGNGNGTFQAPVVILQPGRSPGAIAAADLNNDGKPDFVEALYDGTLAVFLNNGTGTFGAPTYYQLPPTANPSDLAHVNIATSVALADINGDGKLDLVASYGQGWYASYGVAVYPGNGDGTFGSATVITTTDLPFDMSVGDFNADGRPDVGMALYNARAYGVLTNTTPVAPPVSPFFTDALTGPNSPNLAPLAAGKYGYTPTGLARTLSTSTTDRPVVKTAAAVYLAQPQFTATITVNLTSPDIAYFGFGQATQDPNYFNEPTQNFLFRIHNNWTGYSGIQVWPTQLGSSVNSPDHFFNFATGNGSLATYGGGPLTLMIQRNGDSLTMSIPSLKVGYTFSISQFAAAMGLNNTNTCIFFGNTSAGSVFSDLKITQTPPDTIPPVITPPANITAEATSAAGAVVTFTATAIDNVDGPVPVMAIPASGSTFPIGTTTVGLGASDKAGNIATASFLVTVRDTTAPVVIPPASVTVEATGPNGATVTYPAATATDAVGVTSLTYSQASGTTFPLGQTAVTVTAKDAAGNAGTATFNVTVRDTTPPVINATITPRGGGDDESEQDFTISFSATDAVGVKTLSAQLNGVAVTNGQVVQLKTSKSRSQSVKWDDGKLRIRASAFALVVTAADAAGNTATSTLVPVFAKHGKDAEDKKDTESKD